jgi:hypothetical protein
MLLWIILWLLCGLGTIWFICDFEKLAFDIKYSGWSSVTKQLWGWTMLFLLGPISFILILVALMIPRPK